MHEVILDDLIREERHDLLGSSSAVFSPDRAYRYLLTRQWGNGPAAVFVMLNPSTADAFKSDPTCTRCVRFARREGCGELTIVNLFAYRATNPRELVGNPDPIGPRNDEFLLKNCQPGHLVVAAWGAHGKLGGRGRAVTARLAAADLAMMCLAVTKDGDPVHPLARGRSRVPDDAPFVPWRPMS